MKKLLVIVLMFQSLISFGQEDHSTIYIWLKGYRKSLGIDVTMSGNTNVLNIGQIKVGELLEYKMYSHGRVKVALYYKGGYLQHQLIFIKPELKEQHFVFWIKGMITGFDELDSAQASKFLSDPEYFSKRVQSEEDINTPIGLLSKERTAQGPKSGTGFLLSENGLVVTNHHVIEKANKITLKGINGDYTTTYTAKVIADDEKNDLAILQLENKTIKFEPIPYTIRAKGADTGEDIYVLGYPMITAMGEEVKLTTGVISSKTGYQGDITSYQVSAPVQGGNSGGPMFDKQGNLSGIINAKIMGAEGVTYAIKTNYLNALIDLLPTAPALNETNKLTGLSMAEQVKLIAPFVYIIEVNN